MTAPVTTNTTEIPGRIGGADDASPANLNQSFTTTPFNDVSVSNTNPAGSAETVQFPAANTGTTTDTDPSTIGEGMYLLS
jgi:hypothetical protein